MYIFPAKRWVVSLNGHHYHGFTRNRDDAIAEANRLIACGLDATVGAEYE